VGSCLVEPGHDYHYGNVNVVKGGYLVFREHDRYSKPLENTKTNFWARSIIIENEGNMSAHAGINTSHVGRIPLYGRLEPYGTRDGTLTIHIYGKDESKWDANTQKFTQQNQGTLCQSETTSAVGPCGIPTKTWGTDDKNELDLPGGVRDFFYQYGALYGDARCTPTHEKDKDKNWVFSKGKCRDQDGKEVNEADANVGYFGSKVLAVSYGGTLELAGYKGACHDIDIDAGNFPCYGVNSGDPLRSAPSWTRLAQDLRKDDDKLRTEHSLRAGPNDEIVVTTTDYLPGHSELFTIDNIDGGVFVKLKSKAQWPHNGSRYLLKDRLKEAGSRISLDPELVDEGVETRAAVALLTRSIRIVSAGDVDTADFGHHAANNADQEGPKYAFGAHMVIRQGFAKVQIQGVEFKQMGQGGQLAHYPVHFHMARKTPKDTYVKDSSVNESMTRWFVIHSTHGVTLARNVGYKSIGHGYYLEDGTETDNNFHSNIGIFARAAVDNDQNPRKIPGILAANQKSKDVAKFPYLTDSTYPTVFWITNGWNNFIGNMAAGAGACGAAYWFVPVWNSDHVEVSTDPHAHMKWSGYAGLQKNADFKGTTPLKSFYKNYATSTMMSFQTTGDVPNCLGVVKASDPSSENVLKVMESRAPDPKESEAEDIYYPHAVGGNRHATRCTARDDGTYDCQGIPDCNPGHEGSCAVTVLDHFTSAFHWAEFNVSAIWLRNQWYLLTNSVLSDVQGGGLTFITGGDYTHSSTIKGYWALARNTVFIGHTQPNGQSHPYSSDAGPFNKDSGLLCDWQRMARPSPSNYCLSKAEGISMPLSANGVAQRLFNIYDGPAHQDSNVFLDITQTTCPNTGASPAAGCMYGTGVAVGVRKSGDGASCYLPNAAVAWKQPNGFFYPPAFHSSNLFFNNVDIRHYVVDPLVQAPKGVEDFGQGGTYLTATSGPNDVKRAYCTFADDMFNGFSAIDRQTVLNDDDGSLTGLKSTLSINEDAFFSAPVETAECLSNLGVSPSLACAKTPTPSTARTSPYDYVVTAIAPGCSQNDPPKGKPYGRCGDNPDTGQGGKRWSSECTNQDCYGVPLYRQYLTGEEQKRWSGSNFGCNQADNKGQAKCRWPFIRMAGQNMYQRHTLTLNNGKYYIDTSLPLDTQQSEPFTLRTGDSRDINVFEPTQTYYVFFLYAKPSTEQVYQIYVGDGFDPNTIRPVRGKLATAPIKFDVDGKPSGWFKVEGYKDKVVTITVNFTALTEEQKKELLPQTQSNGLCGPKTFCRWESATSNKCVSNLVEAGPKKDPLLVANPALKKEADAVCQNWAVKSLDCPEAGCFGFSFTLGKDFKANGSGQRLRPDPKDFPPWTTKFAGTDQAPDDKPGGQCYYDPTKPPMSGPCPSAR
jgi:hypothetical protein